MAAVDFLNPIDRCNVRVIQRWQYPRFTLNRATRSESWLKASELDGNPSGPAWYQYPNTHPPFRLMRGASRSRNVRVRFRSWSPRNLVANFIREPVCRSLI